jgi:thiamine-monophosphate kinase
VSTPRSSSAGEGETVADRGEFSLIDAIARRLPQGDDVVVPPGDDAAVVQVDGVPVVVTTDVLVDGRHFRTDWSGPDDIGRRAAAASLADLVAMGSEPVALVVALTAPAQTEAAWVLRVADGLRDEAAEVGASVVGGDISSGGALSVAVTAIGALRGRPAVRRDGAQVGDQVAVAGRLGWAEAGLAVLSRGFRSPRSLVDAYRRPEVPYAAGLAGASAGAHAMCDVSDGLVADLGHIATMSGVSIDLQSDALDIGEPLRAVAAAYGSDPLVWVLGGGHDHAFVATFAGEDALPEGFVRIGAVEPAEAGPAEVGPAEVGSAPPVTVDGAPWHGPAGHVHWGEPG